MQDRTDEELASAIRAGNNALNVNEAIKAKIEQHKRLINEGFYNTQSKDDFGRRQLHHALHIADKVLEYLTDDIRKGKDAQRYIDEIRTHGRPTFLEKVLP